VDNLTDGVVSAPLTDVVSELSCYLGDVSAGLFGKLGDADVLAELREFEALRRRLAVIDHALIAECERRSLPARTVLGSTSTLLQAMLRLSPHEAKERAAASQLCGPRWALTGEQLETLLPQVAAGQAAGVVSPEQARVIASVIEQLPGTVPPSELALAEGHLVEAASQLRPREVALVGQRILAQLDPDGVLASAEVHTRRRSFALIPELDGSYRATGRLTPACGALLQSWLSPRSAPRPAADPAELSPVPTVDSRSHGQRMHDALQELAGLAVRRTELVDSGAPAQVIITMTVEQLASRAGWAETSFGQLLSADEALRLADEAAINLLVRDSKGAVLSHGRTKRIATRAQTLALISRDRGCSFPGCDKPPEWCQRHHIVAWADGGETNLDNLTLVCNSHHRYFEAAGWSCQLSNGLPAWTPPAWIDPERKPRYNQRIISQSRQ
jgi:Domain of unknown function (DUF222)/HNH endonuclease